MLAREHTIGQVGEALLDSHKEENDLGGMEVLIDGLFTLLAGEDQWRDPDSNRGHHDFQWRDPCLQLFLAVQKSPANLSNCHIGCS